MVLAAFAVDRCCDVRARCFFLLCDDLWLLSSSLCGCSRAHWPDENMKNRVVFLNGCGAFQLAQNCKKKTQRGRSPKQRKPRARDPPLPPRPSFFLHQFLERLFYLVLFSWAKPMKKGRETFHRRLSQPSLPPPLSQTLPASIVP